MGIRIMRNEVKCYVFCIFILNACYNMFETPTPILGLILLIFARNISKFVRKYFNIFDEFRNFILKPASFHGTIRLLRSKIMVFIRHFVNILIKSNYATKIKYFQ